MKRGQLFKTVQGFKPRSNVFDLSHEKKLSANMADLIPIYVQEVLPSDKFKGNTEMIIKLAPMIAPIYHRVNAYIHYFFVPNRLIWDNWKDFITGGVQGTANPLFPVIPVDTNTAPYMGVGSLSDYFGIPPVTGTPSGGNYINALPFRAYQLIYNEYYRDQTLTTEVGIEKTDGIQGTGQSQTMLTIRKRQWEKDYFTSALPDSQRGEAVNIPIDPVYSDNQRVNDTNTGAPYTGDVTAGNGYLTGDTMNPIGIENIESLQGTITDLRTAVVLQQWLEKNARAGSRYIEQILAHFGKRVPDFRLQRPEMIGGGKQTVMISEVLANFESAETAQGKMSGHGLSVGNASGFHYKADEHGYIIGILSTIPRTCYYQGLPRLFKKQSKFDFAWPEFANIGEQTIRREELLKDWSTADSVSDTDYFGYTPRYAEYKYTPDSVHGEFRTTLEFWHLGRKFANAPVLNNDFTECNPDQRIFAIQDESTQKLWIQIYNNIRAIRPLPVYGTPVL